MEPTTPDQTDALANEGTLMKQDDYTLEKYYSISWHHQPYPVCLVQGKLISDRKYSNSWVVEHVTSKGDVLAVKFSAKKWEFEMLQYAKAHGILVPNPRYCCGIFDDEEGEWPFETHGLAMVTERVPGTPLPEVWGSLTEPERDSIKSQLRAQISQMQTCTQDTIGRLSSLDLEGVWGFRGPGKCGPFSNEKDYDKWRLQQIRCGRIDRFKWKSKLKRHRPKHSGKFVLTHGNLLPGNIMVQGTTITGILGWQNSGFFPQGTEYAMAMSRFDERWHGWWIAVLKDVLEPGPQELAWFSQKVWVEHPPRCRIGRFHFPSIFKCFC